MAKSSTALPEVVIDKGLLVDMAKEALIARNESNEATTKEKITKVALANEVILLQAKELESDKFVGVFRINADSQVQVQFRIENGALDVSQDKELSRLFGASKNLLFSKEKIITDVIDPKELIEGFYKDGQNPWDFFELKPKKGMEALGDMCERAAPGSVETAEALLPMKGFLATCNKIAQNLVEDAKKFMREYVKLATAPRVVLGSKTGGKA